MAAIDLERGLEHGGRGWGKERPELMDNFDSEMQEWEDQLQDIQRKIEELYNEVQARRGANDIAPDNRKNDGELECGRGHHGNSLHSKNHSGTITVPHRYSNGCNYSPSGYGHPVSHQNEYACCHTDGVSGIGDLLQDYLGQGKPMSRKNTGARHVHFSDTIKVSPDIPAYHNERGPIYERLGSEQLLGSFEENENRKNQVSHMTSNQRRESSPNKENTGAKPPLGQRDAPAVQPRSQLSIATIESPVLDRRSFSPSILGDKKCTSPSVLRKFGAMLQENEGKMLTESGVVTHQGVAPEPKCPTPGCQRRAVGAAAVSGRAPMRVQNQKCQADSDTLTAEVELSQDWRLVSDSSRQNQKDQRGGYSGPKGPQRSPQQSQRRSQMAGSQKVRPRANSGADRDGGLAHGERARKPSPPHVEPKMDYWVSSAWSGVHNIQRGGSAGQDCSRLRDEELIELLDMLEIQHNYSFKNTSYREDQQVQQANPAELSPNKPHKSFSRPARPANQRPPSRWASLTPTARITSPSGPMYCPPSPLARPPSPMTRTPSPALKHRPLISYSLQTETVIM